MIATDNIGIISYNIIAGNANEQSGSIFAIDNDGRLSVTTTNLDYEMASNYLLGVRVNDISTNASYAVITVNVSNVDDTPPVITNHIFSIAENAPTNTLVGTVSVIDESSINNFAIIAGNSNTIFAISGNGQLTTRGAIDYDIIPIYNLTVRAVDEEGYAASNTVSVTVIRDNTPPSITNHTFVVAEDATNGAEVGIVQTSDASGITNFAITTGNSNNAFAVNSNGLLTTATNLNYGTYSNYSLTVEVADEGGNTANGVVSITVIDVLEWQTRYITNSSTNDITANQITSLNQSTIIDGLKGKIFAWLDASVSPLLIINSNNRLTNWLDKKSYVITGTNTNTALSVTTNTNSQIEIISNERVAFTNIVTSTNIILSLILTNAISATPESDVSGNDSLSFQTGSNSYVDVDYKGSDRVGFAIDTTPMGSGDNITAFYLVTERIGGNAGRYPVLGYDYLGDNKRFLTKQAGNNNYLVTGSEGVEDIVLGDVTTKKNVTFSIPMETHLISRRGLSISKSDLNGMLGSFPKNGTHSGEQRIREIIVLTSAINSNEHSNIVKYLYDKWQLSRQPDTTNLDSYYLAHENNLLENAIDRDISTYFQGDNTRQNSFTSNRILFEYRIYGSVLDGGLPKVVRSPSGVNNLYLRTGFNISTDALRDPFRIEVLRTNDGNWSVLSNVPANNTGADKEFIFALGDSTNDLLVYRLLANDNVGSSYWFTIDEFRLSSVSLDPSVVTTFSNTVTNNKIYQTNEDIFLTGFTNYIHFDQAVYGFTTDDFVIENGTALSTSVVNDSNYLLIVRPSPFYGGSNTNTNTVIQSHRLRVSLAEGVVTNASGDKNSPALFLLDFVPQNPFSGFDVGTGSAPSFVDLDGDGNLDMVSGDSVGLFHSYSNNGTNFIEQTGGNNLLNGLDVGNHSTPSFVDLDGDGDMDMVGGNKGGVFQFYSNDGTNFTLQTGGNSPLNGLDVGVASTPTFVDLDGDGDMDMVSGDNTGDFHFYSNDGTNFTLQTGGNSPLNGLDVGVASTPTFVDLDGDGDLDLISGNGAGSFHFYRNNGTNFTEQTGVNNPLNGFSMENYSKPTFVELDGDGDSDVVNGCNSGSFNFYMNIGGVFVTGE